MQEGGDGLLMDTLPAVMGKRGAGEHATRGADPEHIRRCLQRCVQSSLFSKPGHTPADFLQGRKATRKPVAAH